MAQQTRVILLDDLANDDTTEADETVVFALDGKTYEIDLTHANAHALRSALKPFTQAGRQISKSPKRTRRPMTEPAGDGGTYSRHQGGVDPDKARAFTIEHGLIPAGQRGRLATKYKDAYNEFATFGTTFKLDKLKAELKADGNTAAEAQQPTQHQALSNPEAATTAAGDTAAQQPAEDPDEAEARKHYKPLTRRTPQMEDDGKWRRRTASGHPRDVLQVEKWTMTERINSLSEQHMTILGQLVGLLDTKNGKVSHLKTSQGRLHSLEFIEYAPETEHGWNVTDLGRYALRMHSMGE